MKCKIVAVAEFDYDARTDEEISIREGTMLLVLDDSDPEWWLCKERLSNDAFQDGAQGLAPVNYLVEMEPVMVATTLYDYEARTDEEISFYEGATALVYDTSDPDWWFARIDKDAGLVPATYLEASGSVPGDVPKSVASPVSADAAGQKAVLMSALDGFGVSKAPTKTEKEKAPPDVKLIDVFVSFQGFVIVVQTFVQELDKKKKKERKECVIGIGNDYIVYLCEPIFSNVLEKWDFKQVSKFSEKKGKKVIIEFGSDVREFEGEKENLDKLYKRLEEVSTLAPSSSQAPAGKPALALYDYDATNDEELTIREMDELLVLDSSDDDWWNVRLIRGGREGLVPKLYVEVNLLFYSQMQFHEFAQMKGPGSGPSVTSAADSAFAQQEEARRLKQEEMQRQEDAKRRQQEEQRRQQQQKQREEEERLAIERRMAEDNARNARMEEERRRHEEENQRKPSLMARPTGVAMSGTTSASRVRNDAPSQPLSIPSAVPRLPDRPVAPTSKPANDEAKRAPNDKPNPSKVRKWVDKTGSFTVDAEFLGITDGKAQLHKTNGVKIAVPLEKLALSEIEYIRTIPGYANVSVGAAVGVPTPGAARPRPGASTLMPASAYIYNGFDWRGWLLKAGIASSDASEYAAAFVREKLDKSVLDGIDRDVLKALGISEGDIIRIRKYATSGVSASQASKATGSQKIDQILADEQYARQLQEQELHGNSGTTSALLKGGARGRPTGAGINSQSILAATVLLSNDQSKHNSPSASSSQPVNPWGNQVSSSISSSSNAISANSSQQHLLTAQQQQALNAQKQAEMAAKQLQEQRAIAEQQTQIAARKAAELEQQKRQLELARLDAEKNAQLMVMRSEAARLEAQLAEQKRLAALRPMQPALIPTPTGGPNLNFVPVSGARPVTAFATQPGLMQPQMGVGQQGSIPAGPMQSVGMQPAFQTINPPFQQNYIGYPSQPANPNDKYAALKDLDPLSGGSSVFSSANSNRSTQPSTLFPTAAFGQQQNPMALSQGGVVSQPAFANTGILPMGQHGQMGMMQPAGMLPQAGFQSNMGVGQQPGVMPGSLTPQQLLYLQQQQQQQQFGQR
ncbi:cytoskeletal protein binding protein [Entophlyctis sp. JEL0112]|nr:cytoskeletal protein binding protein [Entophlyctis sp. JEL0112]